MQAFSVYGFSTGLIRVKTHFLRSSGHSLLSSLAGTVTDTHWTQPLPVWCWVIDHPDGLIVVDTGLIQHGADRNLFARTQTRTEFAPGEDLASQMQHTGLDPLAVHTLIFTHLHIDHDQGAGFFPNARILVTARELRDYTTLKNRSTVNSIFPNEMSERKYGSGRQGAEFGRFSRMREE